MAWFEIMNIVSKAPEAAALKVHLEAEYRKSEEMEKRLAKLADENSELSKENRTLRNDNGSLREELQILRAKPILVDIGPCSIKRYKDKPVLPGFYCNACGATLDRADYSSWPDSYCCQRCKDFRPGKSVDEALVSYLESE